MSKFVHHLAVAATASLLVTGVVVAENLNVELRRIDEKGAGEAIGTVTITQQEGSAGDKAGLSFHVKAAKIGRASGRERV